MSEGPPSLATLLNVQAIELELQVADMEAAIERLAELLFTAHAPEAAPGDFVRSALERERSFPTCLGEGLAIPHGEFPAGSTPAACLGLSPGGLPFSGPDDKPVEIVVLLAVPADRRDFHVQVLAGIAGSLGQDPGLRRSILDGRDPEAILRLLGP